MIELVVILTILGILSAVALARFPDNTSRARRAYDELLSQIQFARKSAIVQRRAVCVHVDAAQSRLFYASGNCPATIGVAGPTAETPFTVGIPAGVAVTPATFQFDALGRYRDSGGALAAARLTLAVGDWQILIEHDTGYVR